MQTATPYPNSSRIVSGTVTVYNTDVVLNVNTSAVAATINLMDFPSGYFNTQYRLYVKDYSGNCATRNITIVAPTGFKINNSSTYVMNTNGASVEIVITSNVDYLAINTATSAPGITSIPLSNVVFVAKNGNDTTGLVERLDKPFLTIAAARTAVLANFTPSSTNRILIYVYPGNYDESIILADYVDLYLEGCIIDCTSGLNASITDNNVACNSVISGNPTLKRSGSGATQAVRIRNANSNIVINYETISSTTGEAVLIQNGTVKFIGKTISSIAIYCMRVQAGTVTINGDIYAPTAIAFALTMSAGAVTVNGNISGAAGVHATGGTLNINGNVTYSDSASLYALNLGAVTFSMRGNVTSNAIVGAVTWGNGTVGTIYGNISNTGSDATNSTGLYFNNASDSSLTINGNVSSTNAKAISVTTVSTQRAGLILNNSRVVTAGTDMDAASIQDANKSCIFNCVTLIATGTGVSISNSSSVLMYGMSQANKAIGSSVNLYVGTLVVSSDVI